MKIVIPLIFLLFSINVSAEYDESKLNDWLWHAHICKNVAIQLTAIARMENKKGEAEVDKHSESLKQMIAQSVYKNEKEIQFDKKDALFIADLVFAARDGIKKSGGKLNPKNSVNAGFNICTHVLSKIDNEMRNKTK